MSRGEKILRFLGVLMLDRLYGAATMHLELGKVTDVDTETRRVWDYKDMPVVMRADGQRPGLAGGVEPTSG